MTRALIVNADDYGRTSKVSEGIRAAHLRGIVTTTTVMMNLPGAAEDVLLALAKTPTLGLGVHLNLTYGRPIAAPSRLPSITAADGQFLPRDVLISQSRTIRPGEAELEWRAQIERFLQTGAVLDHLDSHHHIAALKEGLWKVQIQLAEEYGCGVRAPFPDDLSLDEVLRIYPAGCAEFAAGPARNHLAESGVFSPDRFLAGFFGAKIDLPHLLSMIEQIPAGVSEIMCHPGFTDPDLLRTSGYAQERLLELQTLTSPELKSMIREEGIHLSTFKYESDR
jgi:predicted glycoside hydrolase/deacetylase ChbG (UPF0249 family)